METRMISRKDYYVPDIPKDEPVSVRHISLTAEQARSQGWHYKRKSNGRLRITQYTGSAVNITVPAEIGGAVVNEVGERVFFERVMNSIEFPDTVKKIGERCCQQSTVRSIMIAGDVTVIPHGFALACCTNLRCVEWGGNKVYLPSEVIEMFWQEDLLKAFTCKNGKDIFDSTQFAQVFSWRFQNQRTRIVLAVDVMWSTPSLFPDREIYRKYLDNHRKYALIICDELPEDYSAFLHAYFGE